MGIWSLDIESAGSTRQLREVDQDLLIVGRGADCDVRLADQRVSRHHCRLERRGPELWIQDLGSRAGTRLNGRRLESPERLSERDRLTLSDQSDITVRWGRRESRPASTSSSTVFRDAELFLSRPAAAEISRSPQDLWRYTEQLRILNEVHRALFESPSRHALLAMVLDRVFDHLRPEQAALVLVGAEGQPTEFVTRPPGLPPEKVFFSRSLFREVTERRQAALVVDAPSDARFVGSESILDSGVHSALAAPLLGPDGALGMIVLSSRARVRQFREEDLDLLVPLASVAAMHLRNLALAEEAAERQRLAAELELARRIQLALLPSRLPEVAGYELLGANVPSRGVSGDLYKVDVPRESGLVTCLVCDISGKGMAASLLGASIEALAAGPIEVGHPPETICERVSRRLFARSPPEKYATGFVAQLDPATHRLAWANAGHNPALLVRASGEVERLTSSGPPLGVFADATFEGRRLELDPGDLLVVYTDGFTEAVDPEDEEFGLERLEALLRERRTAPLPALRDHLDRALDAFVRGVPYADDRTILLLRRVASP